MGGVHFLQNDKSMNFKYRTSCIYITMDYVKKAGKVSYEKFNKIVNSRSTWMWGGGSEITGVPETPNITQIQK